jgi:hypothetical protein
MKTLETILRTPLPDALYHYTTQEGLLGIVSHKEIWATKIQYLNDSTEFALALELARTYLEDHLRTIISISEKDRIETLLEEIQTIESINICVCSFSEVGDLLSQWRAYGGSRSGYSIGFFSETLKNLAAKHRFILTPCVYDEVRQKSLIAELIKDALSKSFPTEGTQRHPTEPRTLMALPVGGDFTTNLLSIAPIIKHESFSEEKEWRLISAPISCQNPRFTYRPGASMMIPYFRFPLCDEEEPLEIKTIIVGPTPHARLSVDSVVSLLGAKSVSGRQVVNSRIPYRNW